MFKSLIDQCTGFATAYYDWVAGGIRWLARKFQWERVSAGLTGYLGKTPAGLGIELAVAVSLAVYFFFLLLPESEMPRQQDGNTANAYLFTNLSHYRAPVTEDYAKEFPAWGPRVASQALTGAFWDGTVALSAWLQNTPADSFPLWTATWNGYHFGLHLIAFAAYQTIWLALLYLMLIWCRRDALLIMLGTFAGLMYNFTIPSGEWFFPWDLPSLFLFTWMVLVFDKGRYAQLLLAVFLASLVKETGLVGGLLVLFGPWSWRKRILGFAGLFVAFLGSRQWLLNAYDVHTVLLPFNNATSTGSFFSIGLGVLDRNLINLFSFHLNSAWFCNGGLLFLILLFPCHTPRQVLLKFVALAFVCGQFLFGYAHEFREWYEVLPLGWMMVSERLFGRGVVLPNNAPAPPAPDDWLPARFGDEKMERAAKGSYWLAATGVAVIAAGVMCGSGLIRPPHFPIPSQLKSAKHLTDSITDLNNLAWQFATSPDDSQRDGKLAVDLAERACAETDYRIPAMITTLSAAYAEVGRFDEAIAAGKKAGAMAAGLGDTNQLESTEELLLLYQNHEPYHVGLSKRPESAGSQGP